MVGMKLKFWEKFKDPPVEKKIEKIGLWEPVGGVD